VYATNLYRFARRHSHMRVRCGVEQLPLGHVVVAVLGNVMDRGGDAVKVRKFRLRLILLHLFGKIDVEYESRTETDSQSAESSGQKTD